MTGVEPTSTLNSEIHFDQERSLYRVEVFRDSLCIASRIAHNLEELQIIGKDFASLEVPGLNMMIDMITQNNGLIVSEFPQETIDMWNANRAKYGMPPFNPDDPYDHEAVRLDIEMWSIRPESDLDDKIP